MGHSPATLRAAAVVQAVESAVVLAAAVLAGVDTAAGRSYQQGSGIALTVIGVASAAVLALVAVGLARVRRWSRTPALLTQVFFGIVGIYLLQAHRLEWGVPLLVLAVAGLASLLAPPSLRALTRQGQAKPEQTRPGQAKPEQTRPGQAKTGQAKTGQTKAGQTKARQTKAGQTRQARTRPEPGPPGKASRRRSARPGAE
jgi:hypothetical protein